jgi:hypothetical protein
VAGLSLPCASKIDTLPDASPPVRLAALLLFVLLAGCTGPSSPTTTNTGSGIQGHVGVGPTCPVERDPPDPNCADKPYHGSLAVADATDDHTVLTFETDEQGNFTDAVGPGNYTIRNVEGDVLPACSTETFAVKANAYTNVDVSCDSGIR